MNAIKYAAMDILAVAWKDLQVFSKDRGNLVVLFVLPLLLASMFASINASDGEGEGENGAAGGPQFDIYLVNQDTGPYGAQVAGILEDVGTLDVEVLDSAADADQKVADGLRLAAVIIPADFSAKVDAYEQTSVSVITDPTQEQFAGIITGIVNEVVAPVYVRGEVQHGIRTSLAAAGVLDSASAEEVRAAQAQTLGVIMTQIQRMQESPVIRVVSEDPEGVKVATPANFFSVLTPAFTVWFAFFLVPMMGEELMKEKEEGTLRRLLSAPIGRGSVISGKMLAYMLVVVLQVLVIFGVTNIIFDMPLGNSPIGLLLITLALALSAAALGMMIAALARSRQQAVTVGMILGFVLAGAGGAIVIGWPPAYLSEGFLGTLSKLTPHGHALLGYYKLMVEDGGLVDILPQVVALVAMSAVFFLVARWRFRLD